VFSVVEDAADDRNVRGRLLRILPRVDKTRAFKTALWILGRHEDRAIHESAVAAIELVGDKRAIPYIERTLEGADANLRRVGERALERLRGQNQD
jgi:HEAT repeat protein